MQITITTNQILKLLYIFSWIIFIGVCIEACSILFIMLYSLFLKTGAPWPTGYFYQKADFSSLYAYDHGHYFVQISFMCIVAIMKALMFYLIVMILHHKKLNLVKPFNRDVLRFIFNLSYLAFLISLFSSWGIKYSVWLTSKGVIMPNIEMLHLGGGDVWLFMAVVLFIIAQIFKKGIEIQTENELTV